MVKTIQALSDRMVRAVVPRVTAQAHYCGEYYLEFCYCTAPNWAHYRSCYWQCWQGDDGPLCGAGGCTTKLRGC